MTIQEVQAYTTEKRRAFQAGILTWSATHSRDYPWRHPGRTPYQILIAELLLKRTTATAVARAYEPFLSKYPTIVHLASATEEDLAQDLVPVGLYKQRSRAITKLAHHLMEHESRTVPDSLDRLLKVPGLGEYSARAILSFGFGIPAAVVDANVERVIVRVFKRDLPEPVSARQLQSLADGLLPQETHRDYNFGLLDLGGLVCRYVDPSCEQCPLNSMCDYYRESQTQGRIGERRASYDTPTELQKARRDKGLSLAKLAQISGVSKLTIIKIEARKTVPQTSTLQKLANALGINLEELTPQ